MTLREQLLEMAEPAYRDFTMPLMPGVEHVIGIRVPKLRLLAREIVRGDWRSYLDTAEDLYFEERLLQGLVIGLAKCDPAEKLRRVARFVPKIDNWALCDLFCWRLKAAEREPMWGFIRPYFRSGHEFELRFAAAMGLSNFVDAEHLDALLAHLDACRHEGYYARMGVAWALSVCYVKFPERTAEYLHRSSLDDWTYDKALQKIVESRRVSADDKTMIRSLKRRR